MKVLITLILLLLSAGIAEARTLRELTKWLQPEEICYEGVVYLKFDRSLTAKFLPNGKIETCDAIK